MPQEESGKLSTKPYKGVRDFYPRDMFIQNYLFNTMREVAERYGYSEYSASILEPTELYKSKTSEEIVNEQTYTFEDRGGRSVTLRPEITPSAARMVAAKRRELAFPLRWYSIPNVFRYERPQRGRLREHWQLNCDIFGIPDLEADIEIITLSYEIMKAFGAEDDQFKIKIGSRSALDAYLLREGLNDTQKTAVFKVLDHKEKSEQFEEELIQAAGKKLDLKLSADDTKEIDTCLAQLVKRGVGNASFDISIVRGFDYYSGIVFEVFDTAPENRRALFGGGRYDNLFEVFGSKNIPAVGFGMGDVALRDFLETHGLLPEYVPTTDLYLCVLGKEYNEYAQKLAKTLRKQGLNVSIDPTGRKAGDQIKTADKQGVPFVACVGENEEKNRKLKVKHLSSGTETELPEDKVGDFIWKQEY